MLVRCMGDVELTVYHLVRGRALWWPKAKMDLVSASAALSQQMLLLPTLISFLLGIAQWASANDINEDQIREFYAKNSGGDGSSHTNNWAVLVFASRYWFNYRVCRYSTLWLCFANRVFNIAYG